MQSELMKELPQRVEQYRPLLNYLESCAEGKRLEMLRALGQTDLYFLLRYILNRKDMENDWILSRCREVQERPDGMLDLWPRGHYKSSVITYGKVIQDIIINPEVTISIFSHTSGIARGFLRQIKTELERNVLLKGLYSDVLYNAPERDAPKWSDREGLVVKRKGNPKECTVESWGVVDGQPTSKHFTHLIYDDLVTLESVSTAEQIEKCIYGLQMSFNLGSLETKKRFIGTRYAAGDPYDFIMENGIAEPRIYTATKDGTLDGEPVLLSKELLQEKRKQMGSYVFSTQMLNNPLADNVKGFQDVWLQYYEKAPKGLNIYITVDPAGTKENTSDYTVMMVIGLDGNENYYVLDMVRDRLNLTERIEILFNLREKWRPKTVGYERYGMMGDIDYLKKEQDRTGIRFPVIELGGKIKKETRIEALQPIFESGHFYLPKSLVYKTIEGKKEDLVERFKYEYKNFPRTTHDDMLDATARILDEKLNAKFPRVQAYRSKECAFANNKVFVRI